MTHTYVELEVSAAVYDEIAMKLKNAGYAHVFLDNDQVMDMHGIALKKEEQRKHQTLDHPLRRGLKS